MSRNNAIDFWRIVFTYMIVVFHFDTTFPYVNPAGSDTRLVHCRGILLYRVGISAV